ncbi:MAG: hypothetical protein ACI9HK_006269, partial [Pirellulaceae bacterium]
VVFVGCGKPAAELPMTYAVTGTVVDQNNQPITKGQIIFQAPADKTFVASAEVQADGTFTLTTKAGGKDLPGAVQGQHEVTYFPPLTEEQTEEPVTLKDLIEVEPKEVNRFDIRVEFE